TAPPVDASTVAPPVPPVAAPDVSAAPAAIDPNIKAAMGDALPSILMPGASDMLATGNIAPLAPNAPANAPAVVDPKVAALLAGGGSVPNTGTNPVSPNAAGPIA